MIDQIMSVALLICGFTLALTILANIVGATVYDVRAAKHGKLRRAHPHARRYRQRPLLSVLVMAENDEATVTSCLDSLRRSSYRKQQIIVIDNASTDATRARIRAYRNEYPQLNIRLVAKRRPTAWAEAAHSAGRKYVKGELVLLLEAGDQVERQALKRAVDHLNDRPDALALGARRRPVDANSLGGLLQTYLSLLSQRSHKAGSLIYKKQNLHLDGLCCRRQALNGLLKAGQSETDTYVYAHDVLINQRAAGSFYGLCREQYRMQRGRLQSLRLNNALAAALTVCSGLTALLIPLLASYFIWLAVDLREPLFLVLSLAGLGLWLLAAVWGDEQLGFRQRLAYTLGIPITYSLFFGLAWIRLLTAFRLVTQRRTA